MRLYNACLGEAEIRRKLMQSSEVYQQAKKHPKTTELEVKQRNELFNIARKQYRYSDFDLQAYAKTVASESKWIQEKLHSQIVQKLATRAFKASEKVLLGRAKKVRFKVSSRFRSIEGKQHKGIIFKADSCLVVWSGLELPVILPKKQNDVLAHGYTSPVKYCRILWREFYGRRRWYVQLINSGVPYAHRQNTKVKSGLVGIDLNVSNVAVVGDDKAGLHPFADCVPTFSTEIKALQGKMQRSQRVSNPNNYSPDTTGKKGRKTVVKKGQVKKGARKWNHSKTYQKTARKKRNLERRKSAYAKSQNRCLTNKILREYGNNIKAEKVAVLGWQKRYGKAISAKCPGFFQSELKRKAENAGGKFTTFSTQKTALSQTHLDGTRIKKSLSERVHKDVTGFEMHRDLFSAYLSRFVNDNDEFQCNLAASHWVRSEPILVQAWNEFKTREIKGESGGRLSHSSSERVCTKLEKSNQIAEYTTPGEKLDVRSNEDLSEL